MSTNPRPPTLRLDLRVESSASDGSLRDAHVDVRRVSADECKHLACDDELHPDVGVAAEAYLRPLAQHEGHLLAGGTQALHAPPETGHVRRCESTRGGHESRW